jgi:hypothetical protein
MRSRKETQTQGRCRRVRYADVMSTVAVFLALGGTSYAVARNSVDTKHLKRDAVTSVKVRDGSLMPADFAGTLATGNRGPRGSEGPAGPQGGPGPAGERGPSDAWIAGGAGRALSTQANVPTLMAKLAVPAGDYLLSFSAQPGDFNNPGEIVSCDMRVNGTNVGGQSIVIGNGAGSTRVGGISRTVAVSRSVPFEATLECRSDQSLGNPPGVQNHNLVATKVQSLHLSE